MGCGAGILWSGSGKASLIHSAENIKAALLHSSLTQHVLALAITNIVPCTYLFLMFVL